MKLAYDGRLFLAVTRQAPSRSEDSFFIEDLSHGPRMISEDNIDFCEDDRTAMWTIDTVSAKTAHYAYHLQLEHSTENIRLNI